MKQIKKFSMVQHLEYFVVFVEEVERGYLGLFHVGIGGSKEVTWETPTDVLGNCLGVQDNHLENSTIPSLLLP